MITHAFSALSRSQLEEHLLTTTQEVEALRLKVAYYEEQLKLKKLKEFGTKSEKTDPNQLSFFNEAEESSDPAIAEPKAEKVCPVKRKKQKGKKAQIIRTLPKETVTYTLTEEEAVCPDCGNAMHEMKKQIHNEIELIPAKVILKEHVQQIYSCRNCEITSTKVPVITAPMPSPLLRGSLLSPSMGAHLCCRKYENRDPIEKIAGDFQREGIQLSKQTLSNWVLALANQYLQPVYNQMQEHLLASDIVHADETRIQVLHEPERDPKTKSYMWLYRTGKDHVPIVLYAYSPTRRQEEPERFLEGFRGYLQTDGYAGYGTVGKQEASSGKEQQVIRVGCMSHVRRYYWDAEKALPKDSLLGETLKRGIDYCNTLFALDQKVKQLEEQQQIASFKEEKIRPVFEAFFAWADAQSDTSLPKGKFQQAITYTKNQKKFLMNYLKEPRLEISNNLAERAIRPFVMGRKNWLFCNTPKGAHSSAVIYSVMQTALENNLSPFPYFQHLFDQLRKIDLTNTSAIDALLPWSKSLPDECRTPRMD